MKKLSILLAAVFSTLALTACSENKDKAAEEKQPAKVEASVEEKTDAAKDEKKADEDKDDEEEDEEE